MNGNIFYGMIRIYYRAILFLLCITFFSCQQQQDKKNSKSNSPEEVTFSHDLSFLKERDTALVLLKKDSSYVVVSPKYQAKVFTSTALGMEGQSFGWINYEAFDAEPDPHIQAYGGENRFWLGPEGGIFSLFFKPGEEMIFDNWKTPAPIDSESWEVVEKEDRRVKLAKEMSLLNYAGTNFHIGAEREVKLLEAQELTELVGSDVSGLQYVGYMTRNSIKNLGNQEWTKETGAPCIWILDMFPTTEETTIALPYKETDTGKIATTDYFEEIPEDRITFKNSTLFFKADGKSRGKLGLGPERAKRVAGSYDAVNQTLTLTIFDIVEDAIYLNQEWSTEKDPFRGDAVNAYNDGPLEDGSQMGPFYEIESVSPAAFLKPAESLEHTHSVFHFTGEEELLNNLSQNTLGVSLDEIRNAL